MKKSEKTDNIFVIKKDNTLEKFDIEKVIVAVNKSSQRALKTLSKDDMSFINDYVTEKVLSIGDKIPIITMHSIVESCLDRIDPSIAKSYRDYRNYKTEFVEIMDEVFKRNQDIMYRGDKENANADSALVSTKRSLSFNVLNEQLYRKFFLNTEELQAQNDGYIYIHDKSARRDTMNCCLFNMAEVLDGGFEMSNMFYNEPKTLDTAFDVAGDIILAAAGQQYGGFTVPQVDQIMEKYAEKSYKIYYNEYISIYKEVVAADQRDLISSVLDEMADNYAVRKLERDFRQGFQGWEYKLNTVASCRGDYPFITITVGLGTSRLCKMATKAALRVHKEGQGKPGHKKPALFPKIVFLYDKNLHGKGCISEDLYHEAIDCSAKTMYPDWLSLTGKGYVAEIYKRFGKAISPMGCRAFLSPWYERGGMHPADENDVPVFIGRFNIGAVSLHLPMILAKSREEDRDFYEVLDYYLEMIRNLHLRTYDYLGKMRASVNPLAYCEGGFYGGHLKPTDRIEPLLESATASFGITALNELQELYNGKSLVEDGQFALEVMKHINDKINQFKEEDGRLYAIYGTPAESLCGVQIKQFRAKYGIIKGVSDKEYVSNSFHCHVTEDISPIEKQNLEYRFWNLLNGGKIQYVKYPISYNTKAIETLVDRAMDMGYYEGVNLALSYCDDCGYEALNLGEECPNCGSKNLTKIDRMNGYLAFSRVKGESRMNTAKMAEINERKSM